MCAVYAGGLGGALRRPFDLASCCAPHQSGRHRLARHRGSGHSAVGKCRPSFGRNARSAPLPDDQQAWDIAAEAARNGDVAACGRAMLQAYAVDDDALFAWWWDRMPTR